MSEGQPPLPSPTDHRFLGDPPPASFGGLLAGPVMLPLCTASDVALVLGWPLARVHDAAGRGELAGIRFAGLLRFDAPALPATSPPERFPGGTGRTGSTLSIGAVADLLGTTVVVVRMLVDTGGLVGRREGATVVVERRDLAAWLRTRRSGGRPDQPG